MGNRRGNWNCWSLWDFRSKGNDIHEISLYQIFETRILFIQSNLSSPICISVFGIRNVKTARVARNEDEMNFSKIEIFIEIPVHRKQWRSGQILSRYGCNKQCPFRWTISISMWVRSRFVSSARVGLSLINHNILEIRTDGQPGLPSTLNQII